MQNPDLFPQHLQDPDLISPGSADRLLSPGSATVVVRNPDLVNWEQRISPVSATVVVAKPGLTFWRQKSVRVTNFFKSRWHSNQRVCPILPQGRGMD